MTTAQRNASRVRGEALTRALEMSRAGQRIEYVDAMELYVQLTSKRADWFADLPTVYTSGGAVVQFVRLFGGYAVKVSASPI